MSPLINWKRTVSTLTLSALLLGTHSVADASTSIKEKQEQQKKVQEQRNNVKQNQSNTSMMSQRNAKKSSVLS